MLDNKRHSRLSTSLYFGFSTDCRKRAIRLFLTFLLIDALWLVRAQAGSTQNKYDKIITVNLSPTFGVPPEARDQIHRKLLSLATENFNSTNDFDVSLRRRLMLRTNSSDESESTDEFILKIPFSTDFAELQTETRRSSNKILNRRRLQNPQSDANIMNSFHQVVPLSLGFGTHFATVWVGTPPQRKSVIIDTGSHFTAFPCAGCQNCGSDHHTSPRYFQPSLSETFTTVGCDDCASYTQCEKKRTIPEFEIGNVYKSNVPKCIFSQSYTEGSSWSAYQAKDMFYVGNSPELDLASDAHAPPDSEELHTQMEVDPLNLGFGIPFMFGCQLSQSGLFVTQLEDGIMGMSASESTLAKEMYEKQKVSHNMFTLCFRNELAVSKGGMSAGIMTIGGVDNRLNLSPMVYAKDIAYKGKEHGQLSASRKTQWYTVRLKNIFMFPGNPSITSDKHPLSYSQTAEELGIVRVENLDLERMNAGKGIIVDSGTTDTYLSSSMADEFYTAWRKVTGMEYSNSAIPLTTEQLRSLPTLLFQLQAHGTSDEDLLDVSAETPGLVGNLDPSNSHDVLLAVPSDHYMEFSPMQNAYISRIYVTENTGGVLGANVLQGHDVLFDWENGRIGIARSLCEYETIMVEKEHELEQSGYLDRADKDETALPVDCILSDASLSTSCLESVDSQQCNHEPNSKLAGFEVWKRVVRFPSSLGGLECEEVARRISFSPNNNIDNVKQSHIGCNIFGVCQEEIPCSISCDEANRVYQADLSGSIVDKCGDQFFGACQTSCTQSRLTSIPMDDGNCHEEQVTTRPCHVGACSRNSLCIVPFMVHAVFGFSGSDATAWTRYTEEMFLVALSQTLKASILTIPGKENIEFGPGDIRSLMVHPWKSTDGSTHAERGMKIIAEIGIYNSRISQSDILSQSEHPDDSIISCTELELVEYAKLALTINTILQDGGTFLQDLSDAFDFHKGILMGHTNVFEGSFPQILTSWTIKSVNSAGNKRMAEGLEDGAWSFGKIVEILSSAVFMSLLGYILLVFGAVSLIITHYEKKSLERFRPSTHASLSSIIRHENGYPNTV